MSLYREVGRSRRAIAIAAVVALIVGLGAGYGIGRATAPDPTLEELVDDVGEQVRPALNALELITVEYPQAVDDGGRVTAETELQAAGAQAAAAAGTLEAAGPRLEALDPEGYSRSLAATRRVGELIDETAPDRVVVAAANRASAAIAETARLGP